MSITPDAVVTDWAVTLVRFLFTFTGGTGHFIPTIPFARALAARGHAVRYACQESMVPVMRSRGWEAVPSGGSTLLDPGQRLRDGYR